MFLLQYRREERKSDIEVQIDLFPFTGKLEREFVLRDGRLTKHTFYDKIMWGVTKNFCRHRFAEGGGWLL